MVSFLTLALCIVGLFLPWITTEETTTSFLSADSLTGMEVLQEAIMREDYNVPGVFAVGVVVLIGLMMVAKNGFRVSRWYQAVTLVLVCAIGMECMLFPVDVMANEIVQMYEITVQRGVGNYLVMGAFLVVMGCLMVKNGFGEAKLLEWLRLVEDI